MTTFYELFSIALVSKGNDKSLDSKIISLRIYLSLSILRTKGDLIFEPVDSVDLKKRLPKEAGVVHPNALSFFAGPNCLPKSEAGLHHCLQRAKV